MNKKFLILLLLPVLLLTGCGTTTEQKQVNKEEWDIKELFVELDREEEQKLKPICNQEMIPAKYASDCYLPHILNVS